MVINGFYEYETKDAMRQNATYQFNDMHKDKTRQHERQTTRQVNWLIASISQQIDIRHTHYVYYAYAWHMHGAYFILLLHLDLIELKFVWVNRADRTEWHSAPHQNVEEQKNLCVINLGRSPNVRALLTRWIHMCYALNFCVVVVVVVRSLWWHPYMRGEDNNNDRVSGQCNEKVKRTTRTQIRVHFIRVCALAFCVCNAAKRCNEFQYRDI